VCAPIYAATFQTCASGRASRSIRGVMVRRGVCTDSTKSEALTVMSGLNVRLKEVPGRFHVAQPVSVFLRVSMVESELHVLLNIHAVALPVRC